MKIRRIINHHRVRWRVNWSQAGKQKRSFFPTEDAAKKFVTAKTREQAAFGNAWLDLSPARRVELMEAAATAARAGFSVKEAVEDYAARVTRRSESVLLSAAVVDCLASKSQQGLRSQSQAKLRQTLTLLADSYGERTVEGFTTAELERWLGARGWSAATRKTKRADLQTFFSWAVTNKLASENPAKGIPVPLQDDRAPGILTVAACRKLMAEAHRLDKASCGYFSLCLFAGIRPAEVLRLRPDDIQLDRGFVVIAGHKAKTRQRRIVELEKNCVAWCRVGLELPFRNWRKRVDAVRLAAGLVADWPKDGMRHSFASYYYALSGSPDKTAGRLGHGETGTLFRHYRELATPAQAKAFFAIQPPGQRGKARPARGKSI